MPTPRKYPPYSSESERNKLRRKHLNAIGGKTMTVRMLPKPFKILKKHMQKHGSSAAASINKIISESQS